MASRPAPATSRATSKESVSRGIGVEAAAALLAETLEGVDVDAAVDAGDLVGTRRPGFDRDARVAHPRTVTRASTAPSRSARSGWWRPGSCAR